MKTCGKLDRPAHLRKWNEKKNLKDSEVHLYKSHASHEWDFVDAIYEGRQTGCPCEVGHRSITVSHLANSCAKTGVSSLKWDPVKETRRLVASWSLAGRSTWAGTGTRISAVAREGFRLGAFRSEIPRMLAAG